MRRNLIVVIFILVLAALIARRGDGRVKLFPRRLSPADQVMTSIVLEKWEIEHEYVPSTERFLVSEQTRVEVLARLVQFGLPAEPDYESKVSESSDVDFQNVVNSIFGSTATTWHKTESGRELTVQSSWAAGPAEVSSVCRLLALYYPGLDLDEVDFRFQVGTDLEEEDLDRYGRNSYLESKVRQKELQRVVGPLVRGSTAIVKVVYGPPPEATDNVDPGNCSQYLLNESVQVELFLDDANLTEARLENLREIVAVPVRLVPHRGDSILVHVSSWPEWIRDLSSLGNVKVELAVSSGSNPINLR